MADILGKIITIDRSPKTEQDTLDADLVSAAIADAEYLDMMILTSDKDKVKILIIYCGGDGCPCTPQ